MTLIVPRPRIGVGNDSFTKIMMQYDVSVIADVAAGRTPVTWTNVNTATLGTTAPTPKFGASDLKLVGASSQSLTTPDQTDWSPGGNWTLDCWVYPTSLAGAGNGIMCHTTAGAVGFYWQMAATGALQFATNANTSFITSVGLLALSTWTHIALVGNGATITQYINGSNDPAGATVTVQAATAVFEIGNLTALTNRPWDGYIDSFRFSNGIARWTANFTPPLTPYL